MRKIIIFLILIGILLPSFALVRAQENQGVGERMWGAIWNWFDTNIWPKIKSWYAKVIQPEVEKRKPESIKEELQKEKEEAKKDIPVISQSLKSFWQKFKEIIR